MAATLQVVSIQPKKMPCFKKQTSKKKLYHAQVVELSYGKLSYLYRKIGNEKTRLMRVTYLLIQLLS